MRGFLTGMVSGGMVSGLALAIGSLMAPQPAGNTPPAAPQTSLSDNPTGPAATADPQPLSAGDQAPGGTAPATVGTAPSGEGLVDVDTQPAGVPETGAAPAVPGGGADAAGAQPDIAPDAPVLPSPQTAGPAVPENEADLSISTDPTQPIAPVTDDQDAFIVIDQDALIPLAPDDAAPADAAAPTAGTSRLTDAVPVRRGDNAGDGAQDDGQAVPALVAYAEPFVPDGRPLMSIIMIDSDQFGVQPKVLDDLDMRITMAIRASMPDAAARAARYRAMGHEVVLLSDLPDGALATDAAVALEASFAAIPEAVALLDAGLGGLGNDRDVISTSLTRLDQDGRGLLVMNGGLNAALRSAQGMDLPSHVVMVDLDGQDQSPQIIRRFLDQGAFRARQDGAVSVLTRLRPDTLSALTVWSGASRAQDVQLAPISALLSGDPE